MVDWLEGWDYRKSHVVKAATGAGINYQKRVKAHFGSFDDSITSFLESLHFERDKNNPILSPTLSWEGINIADQVVFEDDNELKMYYSGFGSPNSIGLATSPKEYPPTTWAKQGVVLPPNPVGGQWDSYAVRHGNTFKVDGIYYMYYSAQAVAGGTRKIGLATSNNGTSFTRHGSNPLLTISGDETHVEDPTVIRTDATHWYMYYCYRTAAETLPAVKVATSPDGVTWTKVGIVMSKGAAGSWDDTYIEHAQIYSICGYYVLVYEGYGGDGDNPWSHGLAYSTDPIATFTKYSGNPFFNKSGVTGAFDIFHIATPTLFLHGGVWYLFYQGGNNKASYGSSTWKIGLAYNTENVYLDSHGRTDFGDIRFTDDSGNTLLDCWMEEKTDSNYALFWVEVTGDLSTVDKTIYIYYGKSDAAYPYLASDLAQGEATFIVFDDFVDGSYDTSKWLTVGGTPVEASGYLRVAGDKVRSQNILGTSLRLKVRSRANNADRWVIGLQKSDDSKYTIFYRFLAGDYRNPHNYNGGSAFIYGPLPTVDVWHLFEQCFIVSVLAYNRVDSFVNSNASQIPSDVMQIVLESSTENPNLDIDWIFIAKYQITEPTNGFWGVEEETPLLVLTINSEPSGVEFLLEDVT